MALALRLLLLLLLAVALPARAAQAAPLQARRAELDHDLHDLDLLVNDILNVLDNAGAEPAGEGGAASQATSRTEPLGDAEGVSAGRTFPGPLVDVARKPSSRRRGPPRGKNKATGHQKPHEPSENMRQMLKEMQQARQELDGEAGQKEAFPGGSSGSVPASAAGREAMPGTGPGDEVAWKASPLAWLHKVLKPLESPADVSAGRTFPVPLLIPAQKPGSHGRGPLRGKNKGKGQKKPHEPNNTRKQIVTELHKGHANPVGESDLASQPTFRNEPLGDAEVMDQKAGKKEVFPHGSSGSLAAPAAGRKAMPDTGTGTADEVSGKTSPLTWLHKVLVLSEPLSGVPAGRISPAPLVISTQKAGSHGRGPPRGKNKGKGHQKPHEPSKNMRKMLKELLQAGQEKDKKAVQKAAFPRGSSGSMPASAAGREAMPGTGTGDWDGDMDSMLVFLDESLKTSADGGANPVGESDLASQPTFRNEPLGDSEGVSAGRTFPGPLVDVARRPSSRRRGPLRMENKPRGDTKSLEASKHMEKMLSDLERRDAAGTTTHADNIWESRRRVFCWGTPCLKKVMAIVAGAALCLMMCCAAIWYCWKRNWHHIEEKLKAAGWTQDLYCWKSNSTISDSDEFYF